MAGRARHPLSNATRSSSWILTSTPGRRTAKRCPLFLSACEKVEGLAGQDAQNNRDKTVRNSTRIQRAPGSRCQKPSSDSPSSGQHKVSPVCTRPGLSKTSRWGASQHFPDSFFRPREGVLLSPEHPEVLGQGCDDGACRPREVCGTALDLGSKDLQQTPPAPLPTPGIWG